MKAFGKNYWDWWLCKLFSFPVSVHGQIIFWLFFFLYHKVIGETLFGICLPIVVTDRMLKDIKGMSNDKKNNVVH